MKKYLLIFCLLFPVFTIIAQVDSTASISDTLSIEEKEKASNIEKIADELDSISKEVMGVPVAAKEKSVVKAPSISELISFWKIFWAIVFLVIGYFLIRFTSKILEILAEKSTNYRITIKSFIPVVKILGWISVVFLIIAGVFQPPLTTVLTFSASIGVAVGFASQDILKNIFGGIVILIDQPFNSGDKIAVGNYYGEVVEIGLRSTRIVTPDDNLVSIPNSEIMNSSVSNANAGESNCQVVSEIYLPLSADTQKCREIATEAARVSKYVYVNKPVTIIFLNEYKDPHPIIKMKIKAYVLDIRDEFKFKSDVTEIVVKKLIEEGQIKP
ncbi:MAG: mechanosensitive ion channel family protein [Bacteroidota bacterium]